MERLVAAKMSGSQPDRADLEWLNSLPDETYEKVQQKGLCAPRTQTCDFVRFLKEHFHVRGQSSQVVSLTQKRWQTAVVHARDFFGTCPLQSVTRERAQGFRVHLLRKPGQAPGTTMSEATVRKNCSIISGALNEAVKRRLISENPFEDIPKASVANMTDETVVPVDDVMKMIHHTTEPEDKILLALARFAGVRVPSEIEQMRWRDVGSNGVLTIHAKKTKRWGNAKRELPMLTDLRSILQECKPPGALDDDFVLPTLRTYSGLGVRFARLRKSVGIPTWKKFFSMLRKSCASDLTKNYPIADVSVWLGNSPAVLAKYYIRRQASGYTASVAQSMVVGSSGSNMGSTSAEGLTPETVPKGVPSTAVSSSHRGSEAPQVQHMTVVETSRDRKRLLLNVRDKTADTDGNGRYRTRTCDSRRVMAVLYQLS